MIRRLRIVLMAVAVTLVVLELLLRGWFLVRGEPGPAVSESQEQEWEWADKHLRAGRAVFDSTLAFDADLGWRNAPSLRTPELNTNSSGWRADREFTLDKPAGTRRIVFVGDSYTFGYGLSDAQAFPAQLEERLGAGWEVLNFAVPGYGTDQQLLSYEQIARRYAPDVVVLGFFLRDYPRNLLDFRTYAKPRFELEETGLRLVNVPLPTPEQLYAEYASGRRRVGCSPWRSWLAILLEHGWMRVRERDIDAEAVGWRLVARMQERFLDQVRRDGARPLWLQIPTDKAVLGDDGTFGPLQALSREHAARIGLECLDLAPIFAAHDAAHPEDSFHRPPEQGGHLSVTGNRLVAEALEAWLRSPPLNASGARP